MFRSRCVTLTAVAISIFLIAAGCSTTPDADGSEADETATETEAASGEFDGRQDGPPASVDPDSIPRGELRDFGTPPDVPDGPLAPDVQAAFDELFGQRFEIIADDAQLDAFEVIAESGDPRLAWLISDMLRITQDPVLIDAAGSTADTPRIRFDDLSAAASALTGREFAAEFGIWNDLTNALIAWDTPAPPGYLAAKRNIFLLVEPAWEELFVENSSVDWRHLSWGGVLIDDRPYGSTDEFCNCIPGIDDPPVQTVAEADWISDDDVVFGVVINGEARAYPRRIMEVREMVNDSLGGRDFAMPYCTLCGSAQVWFTDSVPEGVQRPILRTSGLLSRSNKVMYDIHSWSIFDTFLGTADSGLLYDQGVSLEPHSVVTSTWGAWVEDYPDTTVLVEELALGRDFDFRNGRDADGPIFPIGDVDPRLAVQADVLGVLRDDGTPLAVHVDSATAAIDRGEVVEIDGIRIVGSGDGIQAIDAEGHDIVGHQAFWFAWSQFYPRTDLWPDG